MKVIYSVIFFVLLSCGAPTGNEENFARIKIVSENGKCDTISIFYRAPLQLSLKNLIDNNGTIKAYDVLHYSIIDTTLNK